MERLNINTSKIFVELLAKMQGRQHLKIVNEPFMPLTIEKVADDIQTPWGVTQQYSLCHYYEQEGDLMQDPEICFLVADRQDSDNRTKIFPFSFCQANMAIYQEPISFMDGKIYRYDQKTQAEITAFADQWLSNIKTQGFLK
ncbi:MAG: hypothetical protein V4553_02300 [Bacteroidota bacterium]